MIICLNDTKDLFVDNPYPLFTEEAKLLPSQTSEYILILKHILL
jgi:hypothetical protein